MNTKGTYAVRWSVGMRILSLVMAFHLFMLPQILTAQSFLDPVEEDAVQQIPPLLEEEVLKHACALHPCVFAPVNVDQGTTLLHQYEERMRDHPLLEVPHQPPR